MQAADATLSRLARAGSMSNVVVAVLLVGCAGPALAAPSGPDYLNLGGGDHAISAHFGYKVEGGGFSARHIVIYHVSDANGRPSREPLGCYPIDGYGPTERDRGSVYAISDDGTILLYQHHPKSAPRALQAKPDGLYEYAHGRGDRLLHGGVALTQTGPMRMNEIAFDVISADGMDVSDGMIRTTDGEEYPSVLLGGNALHRAACLGEIEKIQELLPAGVDIEARDVRGFTPLHEAIWSGKEEAVRLLLARGADKNAIGGPHQLGWTPLQEAARFGHNIIIDMLLESGVDINATNVHGKTPLDIAVEYRQSGAVEHLVARGGKASSELPHGTKYVSPLGNFSAEFPEMGPGMRIQEHPQVGAAGGVSVHDDTGNLRSIVYLRVPDEELRTVTSAKTHGPALETFLTSYIMPELIQRAFPKATVQYTEHVDLGNDSGLFAVVDIPEGSTVTDARSDRRYDTKRGLLILNKGQFMYMLSSGENPKAPHLAPQALSLDRVIEAEKDNLRSFLSRIEFK